jgi:hypothetical protein
VARATNGYRSGEGRLGSGHDDCGSHSLAQAATKLEWASVIQAVLDLKELSSGQHTSLWGGDWMQALNDLGERRGRRNPNSIPC